MSQNRWSLFIVHSLLFIILLTGSYLRFTNLNWDEGQWIHPDEGHMRMITSVIKMPDSLPLYFDTHHSPLNCQLRHSTALPDPPDGRMA